MAFASINVMFCNWAFGKCWAAGSSTSCSLTRTCRLAPPCYQLRTDPHSLAGWAWDGLSSTCESSWAWPEHVLGWKESLLHVTLVLDADSLGICGILTLNAPHSSWPESRKTIHSLFKSLLTLQSVPQKLSVHQAWGGKAGTKCA